MTFHEPSIDTVEAQAALEAAIEEEIYIFPKDVCRILAASAYTPEQNETRSDR